ncbi:NlpC/P60 family protein [Salsuginibacillus kocurii]|uniref:NlpC/P60 family protein n=1 Tax=Salsuginibacillus kocurii TaxID=427078 RepID=UPI000382A49A|nr:NlpC/P60 family protein [Salsuginibacillus kocurii]
MKKLFMTILAFFLIYPVASLEQAEASEAQNVIDAGKEQLGTPYQMGGTTPSAFDCSGFTQHAFSAAGIDLPRTAAEQYNVGESVNQDELQPGDLVFFTTYSSGASHNGIYIGGNEFIHASSSQGVSITSMNNPYWSERYLGARRVLEEQESQDVLAEAESAAEQTVEVTLNGETLTFDGQDAVMADERTLVPMRGTFEALGAEVNYEKADRLVNGSLDDMHVAMQLGQTTVETHNGTVELDEPAQTMNDRTMVPLRFVSETLGAEVEWDEATQTVSITQ